MYHIDLLYQPICQIKHSTGKFKLQKWKVALKQNPFYIKFNLNTERMTDAVTPDEDKSEEKKSQSAKIEPVKKLICTSKNSHNSDVRLPSSVAK